MLTSKFKDMNILNSVIRGFKRGFKKPSRRGRPKKIIRMKKTCPVCGQKFVSLRNHFGALSWKPNGENRKLRMDEIGVAHRDYRGGHYISK